MKRIIKILLPIIIIIGTVFLVQTIIKNPPKVSKGKVENKVLSVETLKLKKKNFSPIVESYGLVEPAVETTLISQVSGKIVYINENFKDGAYFKKGELLIQIEDTDFKADVKIAQANLTLAKQELIEEKAQGIQAKQDWENLNLKVKANDLVLRIPQLRSAQANLLARQAELEKAKLELKRTKIKAPYNGRVIKKNVDIAQVINTNSEIANIYASDKLQIRLPIKNKDLALLSLDKKIDVNFQSSISNKNYKGKVVRRESTIETNSGQLYLIADIYKNAGLNIGEYLTAQIDGKPLINALVIPNSSIYQGSYVFVEKDNIITRQNIDIQWQDSNNTLISKGLKDSQSVVTTTLGQISSGTVVKVVNKREK